MVIGAEEPLATKAAHLVVEGALGPETMVVVLSCRITADLAGTMQEATVAWTAAA
jgi:hypothetical protein